MESWNFSQGFCQKEVSISCLVLNSLPARGDFCCLLITFANSLDPDQVQLNVGPDLDPSCLTHWWYWKNPASKTRQIKQQCAFSLANFDLLLMRIICSPIFGLTVPHPLFFVCGNKIFFMTRRKEWSTHNEHGKTIFVISLWNGNNSFLV